MNSYNGFSPAQRLTALKWFKGEESAGRRARQKVCDACGQTEGRIEPHSEDYSEPFGDHIGAFGLCYPCHMIIHCRFRNPRAWGVYRDHVRVGERLAVPFLGRNWHRFTTTVLADPEGLAWVGGGVVRSVLDDIHD